MSKAERDRLAVARHEACHCVVAQKLGLPVAWITIDPGHDEGIDYGAAVKIPDELVDLSDPDQRFAVLVSMAAPAFLHASNPTLDAYARTERGTAYAMATHHGLEPELIELEASLLVEDYAEEILVLAERLVTEGTVYFDGVVA